MASRFVAPNQPRSLAPRVSLGALLLASLIAVGCGPLGRAGGRGSSTARAAAAAPAGSATVSRVIDGDTIVVDLGGRQERVRLIGIDTPETVSPVKPVQCYGKQASNHTKALLPRGTAVRLVRDVDGRDVYGRLLAYVYRRADGLFVNLELAADGYASLLTYPPNVAHVDQFRAAVAAARRRDLGLWRTCGGPGVPASERR
jgi:micrococcal nuclease